MEVERAGFLCYMLDQAVAPTLERIRRDRQRSPRQLRPLLAYLERNLFHPDLDATRLMEAGGVRDKSVAGLFHEVLAMPPYAYIEHCRMEIACRLLGGTEIKVWQVARLLGYSSLPVFSRAFHRWAGVRPTVYRRRCREAEAEESDRWLRDHVERAGQAAIPVNE